MTHDHNLTDAMVNEPAHYQSDYGFQVIDVIKDYTQDLTGIYAVEAGNMIKYICRWHNKNGTQDIKKALWYCRDLKDQLITVRPLDIFPTIEIEQVVEAFAYDGKNEKLKKLQKTAIKLALWWSNDVDLDNLADILELMVDEQGGKL